MLLVQTGLIIYSLYNDFDLGLVITALGNLWHLYYLVRLVGHYNPVKNMQRVGSAVLSALCTTRAIQTPKALVSSRTERTRSFSAEEPDLYTIRLHGATVYENNLFIKCVQEIYQRIDNPRYIIQLQNRFRTSYFNVPALFSNNKTNAEVMNESWRKHIGRGNLIFTRNATGRKALLTARKGSFDYDDMFFERKLAVKIEQWK
ncbi:MAG: hypothetical protein FWC77_06395 [Defluviitaleaceae bacterium]|nr:hypothetical protein [Defluviitaleaceae bacterium]